MRVLLVEDEVRLAGAIQRGLEAEGFAVEVEHDGREGLWRARNGSFDVIVLDIMLPGMNGYKVCTALREAGDWTPILMLTAKRGEFDEAEALDGGADDFLRKPFSFVVLTAHLRALLRRGAPERPAALAAGDLRLDPASHRCWRAGTEVDLTPREFSVLEFLMRRPGQASTKAEILEHVWGEETGGDPNLVEVYIAYLRKKIDLPLGRRAIETVRGIGYRLAPDGG